MKLTYTWISRFHVVSNRFYWLNDCCLTPGGEQHISYIHVSDENRITNNNSYIYIYIWRLYWDCGHVDECINILSQSENIDFELPINDQLLPAIIRFSSFSIQIFFNVVLRTRTFFHSSKPWYSWNIAESGVQHQNSNLFKHQTLISIPSSRRHVYLIRSRPIIII